jgi:hypothetical protein
MRQNSLIKHISLTSLSIIAIVLALSSCGDDSTSVSKSEFIKRADEICYDRLSDAEARILRYMEENDLTPLTVTTGDRAGLVARTILFPYYQGQIDEIRSLEAPEQDRGVVTAFLTATQDVVDQSREHPSAFARSLAGGRNPFSEASQIATEYGFKVCGGIYETSAR